MGCMHVMEFYLIMKAPAVEKLLLPGKSRGLANIALGLESCLYMGNIDALRDWGHAKDYVRMQWMMLQQDEAKDYVIATGKQYSVREFITWSANELGIDIEFRGSGIDEVGVITGISRSGY